MEINEYHEFALYPYLNIRDSWNNFNIFQKKNEKNVHFLTLVSALFLWVSLMLLKYLIMFCPWFVSSFSIHILKGRTTWYSSWRDSYQIIVVECEDGTYGKNCVHNCSDNCLNGSPCNKQTGHCDMGCKPGYTTALCNERIWMVLL